MADLIHDLFSLEGRVALVTGASSGIGRHLAGTLARAGADVVLVGRDATRLAAVAGGISEAGGRAHALPADLQQPDAVAAVAAAAAAPFGAPDILLNGAGINLRDPADTVSRANWEATLNINLSVPFFLAQALVPGMRAKGVGNVINIASLQSFRAFADGIAYGASKGGVAQLTRAMAEAWSKHGIVANALVPGFFETELTRPVYADPGKLAHNAAMTAIGRNGEMADLDGAAVFLASRASAYITGQLIAVDGGYLAK
ncbi:MAG: SDR family oxidoreductase [Hyphomicrobiales bacterium]|nr:SDR family oxidoreductase [Hyphomicrobiales bacterium]MCP5370984.1 SDR family oxidoreductase [Hyphomicrobiales bacterium]